MNTLLEGALPQFCRSILQIGINMLLSSLLLCLLGLAAAHLLRGQGRLLQALIYKATFVALLLNGLLAVGMADRWKPLWSLSLPSTQESVLTVPSLPPPERSLTSPARASVSSMPAPLTARSPQENTGQKILVSLFPNTNLQANVGALSSRLDTRFPKRSSSASLQSLDSLSLILVSVWLSGTLLLLAWLGSNQLALLRLMKSCLGVPEGVLRDTLHDLCTTMEVTPPGLLASPQVATPFLVGLRHPMIFLPAACESDFDEAALRAILAHELAHLQRQDCAWNLIARLLCALSWGQPTLWLLYRRWEQVSEEICDQAVLAQNCSPRVYADCLLTLAESLGNFRSERVVGMGVIAFRSSLGRRIQHILTDTRLSSRLTAHQRGGVGVGAMMAAVLAPGMVAATSAPPQETWAKDVRLNRKVAITAEGIPVGDLLAQLSKKTGIELNADAYIADDKVLLFSQMRPLRDTLDDLAALYNDIWLTQTSKDGTVRYRLIRDGRAKEYEDALTRETINRMLAQLDEQVRALGETPEALAKRPKNDPIRQRLLDRDGRMATRFYALLDPAQREALFTQNHLTIPFRALTPDQQEPLRRIYAEKREREKEDVARDPNLLPQQWLEESGLRFLMVLSDSLLHASVGFAFGHVILLEQSSIEIAAISRSGALLPPHGNPYTRKGIPKEASLPDQEALKEARGKADWPDRLLRLAEKSGQPVLADYYRCLSIDRTTALPPFSKEENGKEEKLSALDTLCQPAGYLWWTRNKTLLFRKQDWYSQRLYEVPDRWMLPLAVHLQEQHNIPTYADVYSLTELTDAQIAGLNSLSDFSCRADQKEVSGLRQLLTLYKTGPKPMGGPLTPGLGLEQMRLLTPEVIHRISLTYDRMTLEQRAHLPALTEAQTYPLTAGGAERFETRMTYDANKVHTAASGARFVPVELSWAWGETGTSWIVSLPAALPDDRRNRTKIELQP